MYFHYTSTAGNANITNNSLLNFFDTSTAGNAAITNNDFLQFRDTSTAGSAALVNNAGGTVDFSNSTGPNGDGRLSAGSIAGAGNYVLGANELTVGSNNLSTEVSGGIFGAGSLVKTGTGTLILSGASAYTGGTTISGGTLAVNGSILSSSGVTVNAGGTLGGTGTVGNTTIMSGGNLAAGNSIGTLSINGNLTFNAGGIYTVEVSPTAADRTNVTGAATLTGATVQAVALMPASFKAQTYTILNASGGLGGTEFAGLDVIGSFRPGARNPHLTYDANNVYLVLDRGEIILPSGTNGNQVKRRRRHQPSRARRRDAAGCLRRPAQSRRRAAQECADADLRRDGCWRPAIGLQRGKHVHGADDRPVQRRAKRCGRLDAGRIFVRR